MQPLNIAGIGNGWRVDDFVWRGSQPDDTAWPLLAEAGCLSVIDLSNTGDAAVKQAQLVVAHGMLYQSFGWGGILPPSQSAIARALSMIETGPRPVFIHCLHGSDRTGTLCACWRMHHDGWGFEDAMEEAFTSLGLQGMHEFWMAAAVAEYAHRQ